MYSLQILLLLVSALLCEASSYAAVSKNRARKYGSSSLEGRTKARRAYPQVRSPDILAKRAEDVISSTLR